MMRKKKDRQKYVGLRIYSPLVDAVLIVTEYKHNKKYSVVPEQESKTIIRAYKQLMRLPFDYYIKNELIITPYNTKAEAKASIRNSTHNKGES